MNSTKKNQVALTTVFALLISGLNVFGQQTLPGEEDKFNAKRFSYGGVGSWGYDSHVTNFKSLPGIPNCCTLFDGGTGSGTTGGVIIDFPLTTKFFLQMRGGYYGDQGTLRTVENVTLNVNNVPTPGQFEHVIKSNVGFLSCETLFGYMITSRFAVLAGARSGININNSYEQSESILNPSEGTFTTGSRTRNVFKGNLPDLSNLHTAMQWGASYDIPLDHQAKWMLSPEVFYIMGYTKVVTTIDWTINTYRMGMALKYSPFARISQPQKVEYLAPTPIKPPEPSIRPTLIASPALKKPLLMADLRAVSKDIDGSKPNDATLKTEQVITRSMQPLLNYVFFEDGQSSIPTRYSLLSPDSAKLFFEERLRASEALESYYNVLNVVGKRLIQYPKAVLTLTGCNSNVGGEKGNRQLSRQRAESVKAYFVSRFGIQPSRIPIVAKDTPEFASSSTKEEGNQENRRVELSCTIKEVLDPIVSKDSVWQMVTDNIDFLPQVQAERGVQSWRVEISDSDNVVKSFERTGDVPKELKWTLDQKDIDNFLDMKKLSYSISVVDNSGEEFVSVARELPVDNLSLTLKKHYKVVEKEIEKYSLILFNYNSGDLSSDNQRIVDYVTKRVSRNSAVTITGYTDRLGDEEYNLRLSTERAQATSAALGIGSSSVRGLGEDGERVLGISNELPEGRFYCRTVNIVVETRR